MIGINPIKNILTGIAVDCSTTGGNPGMTECRGIDLETMQIVFSEKIGIATNNIGEFCAIAYAVEYLKGKDVTIWSDSQNSIAWARKGICKTKIFVDYPNINNPTLATTISEAEKIFETYHCLDLRFWDKRKIGREIPADYGRK